MNFDIYKLWHDLIAWLYEKSFITSFKGHDINVTILLLSLCIVLATIIIAVSIIKGYQKTLSDQLNLLRRETGPKFRKRDKLAFYGKKMLRKVQNISQTMEKRRRSLKNTAIQAHRVLRFKSRDNPEPRLKFKEPPSNLLEADTLALENSDLPLEMVYLLKSVKVFGYLEKPLFLEVCKSLEIKHIPAGFYLFKKNQMDDSIYVVQSGKICVSVVENDVDYVMKDAGPGESIFSLLSVVDVLTGHPSTYKVVHAKALCDSTVLIVPIEAFKTTFKQYPESMVRIIQIVMVRLQRVTFSALHSYLGLSNELIVPEIVQEPGAKAKVVEIAKNRQTEPANSVKNMRSNSVQHSIDMQSNEFHGVLERARVQEKKNFCSASSDNFTVTSYQRMESLEDTTITTETCLKFCASLGINDFMVDEMKNKIFLSCVSGNTPLFKEGEMDASLILVISGNLIITQNDLDGVEQTVSVVQSGCLVGALAVLTGEPHLFGVKTKNSCHLAVMSKEHFYGLMRDQPEVVLNVAHSIVTMISPFVREMDFGIDWKYFEAGRSVYRQNEVADAVYLVINGRLRSVHFDENNNKKELYAEHGRDDVVGMLEVLTRSHRMLSVHAIRDTEIAKMSDGLLNIIKRRYHSVVSRLIRVLGENMKTQILSPKPSNSVAFTNAQKSIQNLSTVALIPNNSGMPLTPFAHELTHALKSIGPTLLLTSEVILELLGGTALDPVLDYKLSNWLAQQEDHHKIVLYQADSSMSPWTQRCIRQADCILIVAFADSEPTVGNVENLIERLGVRAQKELVLIYRSFKDPLQEFPHKTADWLNNRDWCTMHHHIRCPKRTFSKRPFSQWLKRHEVAFQQAADKHSDFSRLARHLSGTSMALVLGGGGARGAAQVGLIKTLKQYDIPIDMVGGTSIGAFLGAMYAEMYHSSFEDYYMRARTFFIMAASALKSAIELQNSKLQNVTNLWRVKHSNMTFYAHNLEGNALFHTPVNKEGSVVQLPIDVYDGSDSVSYDITWTLFLNELFKTNANKFFDKLTWQYFATPTGMMRIYPGANISKIPFTFDVRFQPWYFISSTLPKLVVIAVDSSGSVNGQVTTFIMRTINAVLDTLTDRDYVNIFFFKNDIVSLIPDLDNMKDCDRYNQTYFLPVTFRNVQIFNTIIKEHKNYNSTAEFGKAFDHAEALFTNAQDLNYCTKVLMLVTDGGKGAVMNENAASALRRLRSKHPDVRLYIFLEGPDVYEGKNRGIEQIACGFNGYYHPISSEESIREEVVNFVSVLSRSLVINAAGGNVTKYQWTNPELIPWNDESGLSITVAMPAFNTTGANYSLLGCVGIDLPLYLMFDSINLADLGVLGDFIIINDRGIVTFSKNLPMILNLEFVDVPEVLIDDIYFHSSERLTTDNSGQTVVLDVPGLQYIVERNIQIFTDESNSIFNFYMIVDSPQSKRLMVQSKKTSSKLAQYTKFLNNEWSNSKTDKKLYLDSRFYCPFLQSDMAALTSEGTISSVLEFLDSTNIDQCGDSVPMIYLLGSLSFLNALQDSHNPLTEEISNFFIYTFGGGLLLYEKNDNYSDIFDMLRSERSAINILSTSPNTDVNVFRAYLQEHDDSTNFKCFGDPPIVLSDSPVIITKPLSSEGVSLGYAGVLIESQVFYDRWMQSASDDCGEPNKCFLIDSGGFIISNSDSELNGQSLLNKYACIMDTLVTNNVFTKTVVTRKMCACYNGGSYAVAAGSTLSTILQNFISIIYALQGILYTLMLTMTSFTCSLETFPKNPDAKVCTYEVPKYSFGSESFFQSTDSCSFIAYRIPDSNLLAVVISDCSDCGKVDRLTRVLDIISIADNPSSSSSDDGPIQEYKVNICNYTLPKTPALQCVLTHELESVLYAEQCGSAVTIRPLFLKLLIISMFSIFIF